jgi:hypothetical protein
MYPREPMNELSLQPLYLQYVLSLSNFNLFWFKVHLYPWLHFCFKGFEFLKPETYPDLSISRMAAGNINHI